MKLATLKILTVIFFIISSVASHASAQSEPKNFEDKNELLSIIARAAIDIYLQQKGYGELKEFSINNKTKKFFFKTKLKGEEKFLSVAVNKYDIAKENGKYFFVAKEIVTDREWLNIAAKSFLEEKKIEIPQKYSLLVTTIL